MPEVRLEEAGRFMTDALKAVGIPDEEAKEHASLLLHADIVGHYSHGLNRLELYICDVESGATNPTAKPAVLKESASTALVDGCDALGSTVANFCMDVAMKKARETGVGWVSAKRSNHFGMAGYWARKAERAGLIGLAFTNSSPLMVPTRARERACGTNPIAMAAPARDGDGLLVDMASTAVAMGKIEVQVRKDERIPEGWALGPDGSPTTDAKLAFDTGRLLPLGGFEVTGGYKGYALSTIVEVFCSVLSGSNASHQIRSWALDSANSQGAANLGQCFVAVDPSCFAPGFEDRLQDCLTYWRGLQPSEPSLPVLAPGDKERSHAAQATARGKIPYAQQQIHSCAQLATKLRIKPLEVV